MTEIAVTAKQPVPGMRWRIPVVLMISVVIAYLDRMNINFAISKIGADYGWTASEIGANGGMLMSVFYVSYGLSNIFLSPLGARFGVRKSLMAIVVLFSIFTVLQAPFGMILTAFIIVRVLLGLSEGIHFPMMNTATKHWFPLHERSRANGIWIAGIFISMILAPIIIVPIIDAFGWKAMFIVLGIFGMVVTLPLLYLFIHNTPDEHPRVTDDERAYIAGGMEAGEPDETSMVRGIGQLAKKKEYLLAIFCGICSNMANFALISWLPTYFTEGRGLPFKGLTYATSLPYVFSIAGIAIWSVLGDKLNMRAVIAGVGFMLAGAVTVFAILAPSMNVTIALFSLVVFISTTYVANEYAVVQRIVPRDRITAGAGLYNGLAMMVGGGLGPVIIGSILAATGDYNVALLSITAICAVGGTAMIVLGRMIRY